jgi:hypothetical protein
MVFGSAVTVAAIRVNPLNLDCRVIGKQGCSVSKESLPDFPAARPRLKIDVEALATRAYNRSQCRPK